MAKMENKVKDAVEAIEKSCSKLFGIVGLFRLRETADDLTLNPGAVDGVADLIHDLAVEICESIDVIKAEVTA